MGIPYTIGTAEADSQNGTKDAGEADAKEIEVPEEGMVISGGAYYGISKTWFQKINPDKKEDLILSVKIPSGVTTIAKDGFKDSYTSEKKNKGAVTYNDKLGRYSITSIDFSEATSLKTVNDQAAKDVKISGVLDLSNTKIETLGKFAFSGSDITGVILPKTLKHIGTEAGGSVFHSCLKLRFVRVAGGNPAAIFELPEALETIGKQSFYKLTGLPAGTAVTIPESVAYVGSEAFYNTPAITLFTVEAGDAGGYDGKAFRGNDHGLGKRLIVFKNAAAKNSFKPSGLSSYKNSCTYEFTLHYGDDTSARPEPKLWGQTLNICKNDDGSWYKNEAYETPEVNAGTPPVGYKAGDWTYNGKTLKNDTVLKPSGDDLYLETGYVIEEPVVEFIVDGQILETDDTYPEIDLSNDEEHKIGVKVSHPLLDAADADEKVKFEYEWTDVWKGGSQGPRMKEEGFGKYSLWDNPGVTNTITINGAEHERTTTGNYSSENYGDGYYIVEIYGYVVPGSGGQWKLFYKSASTDIGIGSDPDPDRTTDTAYIFDVVTSDPAKAPSVTLKDKEVDYGYDDTSLKAEVKEESGHTYSYQWYEVSEKGRTTGGRPVKDATSKTLDIRSGKDVGEYYYYLEVTTEKTANGDKDETGFPVTFKVNKAASVIVINDDLSKTYDGQPVKAPKDISLSGSSKPPVFTWFESVDGTWEKLDSAPINGGKYKVVVTVEDDERYLEAYAEKEFVILRAENRWDESLTIEGWIYGGYDERANKPSAAAKYGEVKYSYSKEKDGEYVAIVPSSAGEWYVKASVEATESYSGLEAVKKFKVEKALPPYEVPGGLKAEEGQTLGDIVLPEGFAWQDDANTPVGAAGQRIHRLVYTPEDTDNYVIVSDIEVVLNVIAKGEGAASEDPAINTSGDKPQAVGDADNTDNADKAPDGTVKTDDAQYEALVINSAAAFVSLMLLLLAWRKKYKKD